MRAVRVILLVVLAACVAQVRSGEPAADAILTPEEVVKRFDNLPRADFDFERQPAISAAERIHAAFGVRVVFEDDASQVRVSIHLKQASFFEALEALRKEAHLAYKEHNGLVPQMQDGLKGDPAKGIVLVNAGVNQPAPSVACGPLLLVIDRVFTEAFREIYFRSDVQNTTSQHTKLFISGTVYTQQNIPFSGLNMAAVRVHQDEKQILGRAETQLSSRLSPPNALNAYEWILEIGDTAPLSHTPLRLSVTARFVLPKKFEERRFMPLAGQIGRSHQFPYGSIMFNQLSTVEDTTTFTFSTSRELRKFVETAQWGGGFEYAGMKFVLFNKQYMPRLALFAENGVELEHQSGSGTGDGNPDNFTYSVETKAKPHTFLFRMLADSEYRLIELELPSVPVP